jgi:hypothetical protein
MEYGLPSRMVTSVGTPFCASWWMARSRSPLGVVDLISWERDDHDELAPDAVVLVEVRALE